MNITRHYALPDDREVELFAGSHQPPARPPAADVLPSMDLDDPEPADDACDMGWRVSFLLCAIGLAVSVFGVVVTACGARFGQ